MRVSIANVNEFRTVFPPPFFFFVYLQYTVALNNIRDHVHAEMVMGRLRSFPRRMLLPIGDNKMTEITHVVCLVFFYMHTMFGYRDEGCQWAIWLVLVSLTSAPCRLGLAAFDYLAMAVPSPSCHCFWQIIIKMTLSQCERLSHGQANGRAPHTPPRFPHAKYTWTSYCVNSRLRLS